MQQWVKPYDVKGTERSRRFKNPIINYWGKKSTYRTASNKDQAVYYVQSDLELKVSELFICTSTL